MTAAPSSLWPECLAASERSFAREYQAAREGTVLFDGGDRAWLELHGADAVDFLQRILTSDLRKLEMGGGQWSALLDGKGHWIADLVLFRLAPELVLLDLPAARVAALDAALRRSHFGERLAWRLGDVARLLVLGPEAQRLLEEAGWRPPGGAAAGGARAGAEGWILQRPDRGELCFELVGPADRAAAWAADLRGRGAVPGGGDVLEALRIEGFEPRCGAELDPTNTLPECNEWRRASLTKGCYPGQEVVAKVHTYGVAPWQLCRLHFAGGGVSLAGRELRDGAGEAVGRVTSWTLTPRISAPVGLGMVRRKAAFAAAPLWVADGGRRVAVRHEVPPTVFG